MANPRRSPKRSKSARVCTCRRKREELLVVRQPAQDDVFALGVLWYQLIVEQLERPPYDFVELSAQLPG